MADYEQWYGDAHAAPALVERFAFGMPELYRDQILAAQHVASPGCYPTTASLALAPLLAAGLVERTGIVVDAVSGVSGAGRGLKATSLFAEVSDNVNAYGLLTHRHTAEMEQALTHVAGDPVQVLFTPHLVPMTRGILATCYARPVAGVSLSTDALLAGYRDFYAAEPFVHVTDGSPATKATLGSNAAHLTVRYDERTNTVLAIGALDNLVKGASGQALQNANLLLGLPETTAPLDDRTHAVITSVPGFRANGLASGIKESGAPDLAMVATVDGAPVTAAGVFTSNLVAAAPVQISRRHLVDGRAAAVIVNSGNANAATGEPGRADALRMCELTAQAVGCAPSDVLVCQTGLIGIPMPMDPVESGVPKLGAMLTADAAGGLAAADAMLTTDTVRKLTRQPVELPMPQAATVGGMAKGAAMLAPSMATMLAVLATDVAIAPAPLCARCRPR